MNRLSCGTRASALLLLAHISAYSAPSELSLLGVPEFGKDQWDVGQCDVKKSECVLTVGFSAPSTAGECNIKVMTQPGQSHRDIIEFHHKDSRGATSMTKTIAWQLDNGGVDGDTHFRFRSGNGIFIQEKGRHDAALLLAEFDDDSANDVKVTKKPTRAHGRPFFYDINLQYMDKTGWQDCNRKGPIIVNRG